MASEFEENVLISKREYITLKEKCEKSSTLPVGDSVDQTHIRAGKECNCVDKPNVSGQEPSPSKHKKKKVDIASPEGSPNKDKNTQDKVGGHSMTPTKESKNITQTEATDTVSPPKHKSPSKDKSEETKDKEPGTASNDNSLASHVSIESDKSDNNSDDNKHGESKADIAVNDGEKPYDIKEQIVSILNNIPAGLRDKAGILLDQILDSGRGIIEWDDKLQFVYMKQKMPRTNIVQLLVYTLEKEGKAPKGASVFLRALKSIGLGKPAEYISKKQASQTQDNGDGANNEPSVQSETNVEDVPDGPSDKSKAGPVRTSQRKKSRFANLKGKWLPW